MTCEFQSRVIVVAMGHKGGKLFNCTIPDDKDIINVPTIVRDVWSKGIMVPDGVPSSVCIARSLLYPHSSALELKKKLV